MFLHECTHLFNEENLRKALGDLYVLFPCPMSPHDFGVPYTRPRMLTWCFHRDLPLANPPFTVETLKSFNWGTAMEGDVFFSAPKAWVQSYICRRQHKAMGHTGSDVAPNHVRSPALKAASAGMEHLLSGGDFARIRTQEVEELLRRGEDAHDDRIFLADGIAMKGQTASFSKVKKLMPSLMTRSVPWSYRWKRELLPVEGLGVMGIPVFQSWLHEKEQGLYGCPYQHMLTLLNDSDVRRLAGNGMSLQVKKKVAELARRPDKTCAKQLSELEELALTAEDAAAPQVQDHLTKMATIAPQQVKATNVLHLLDSWLTTSMAEWQVVLGSAAAVSLAEEMPTLSSLEPLLELETAGDSKIQAVKTFEQSLSVNGFLKEQTKLMKSLKASVAQAYGKIATTIKTYQKAHKQTLEKKAAAEKKAQKAQAKKKPKSNGDDGTEAASSPSMVGFQNSTPLLAPEFLKGCKAVQGFESADAFRADTGLKWDTPFVVKGIQSPVRERFENPRLRQSAEYFESVLSEKSDSLVRAKCMPDNAGEAQKCLSSLAPAELVVDLGTIQLSDDKVRRSVSGVRLVAQGSKPYIGYDYDDLASFEVAVKGQKQALLFRPCADLSFLVGEDGRLLPAETQLSKLKALTPEQCEQLKPHAMVHTLTVSEALFWPAGWIGVFSAVGKATTFSLALPVLLRAGDASLLWSTSAPRQALLDAWKAAQQQQQAKVRDRFTADVVKRTLEKVDVLFPMHAIKSH
eukprot:g9728.t1